MKIRFKNISGETIPPYGVLAVQRAERHGNLRMYVEAKKPGSVDGLATYFVNGPIAVPNGQFGTSQGEDIVWAAYAGSPEAGSEFGPVDGWTIEEDGRGFQVLHVDAANERALCRVLPESSNCFQMIQFEVKEVGDADHPLGLEAWVRSQSCGCPLRPDQYFDYYQNTVWVIDPLGCFFNQPENDLIGLEGFAARFPTVENADADGCGWWVISLCCPACG